MSSSSCEISGLQAGTDYEITVRGTYAAGDTSESGPLVTFTTGLKNIIFVLLSLYNFDLNILVFFLNFVISLSITF